MHDHKLLDISSAIVCTVVSIIPCIARMNLMMIRKKSIKIIRKEVNMIGIIIIGSSRERVVPNCTNCCLFVK